MIPRLIIEYGKCFIVGKERCRCPLWAYLNWAFPVSMKVAPQCLLTWVVNHLWEHGFGQKKRSCKLGTGTPMAEAYNL